MRKPGLYRLYVIKKEGWEKSFIASVRQGFLVYSKVTSPPMIPAAAPTAMTAKDWLPTERRSEVAADLEVAAPLAADPDAVPETLPDALAVEEPVADAPEEVAEPEPAADDDPAAVDELEPERPARV